MKMNHKDPGRKIGIVCGSFHKSEVERMLKWSSDEAVKLNLIVEDILWVPGAMEVPLALDRLLSRDDIEGAACLGIIEKGQTQHGLAMGQAVIKSIIELQLVHKKPVGLGSSFAHFPCHFPTFFWTLGCKGADQTCKQMKASANNYTPCHPLACKKKKGQRSTETKVE